MQGILTDIQHFSVHDGPGIRTTVFLKGCNMRCFWCHNPETIHPQPELQVFPEKCIGCGACLSACPHGAHVIVDGHRVFHRELCAACGACARTCYAEALVLVGRRMRADEVVAELLQDRPFYENSGGGVTISGGEPLFQRDFTAEILRLCHEADIHTAIESNLSWPWERFAPLLPVTDLVMMDIKVMDTDRHRASTGVANTLTLENARRLSELGMPLIVRTPVIPGVNDTLEEIARIADFLGGLPTLLYYELLPYHPLGTGKYESLGIACPTAELVRPSRELLDSLAGIARERGLPVRIAGKLIEQTVGFV